MKRSLLFVTVLAFSVLAFGAGTVLGGPAPLPPPGWPGGHLFAVNPPNQFPPMGTASRIPLIGQVGLDLDACPDPFTVDLTGFIDVAMPDPLDNSGPTTIPIEIVALSLTSVAPITVNCGSGDDVVTVQMYPPATPPAGQLVDPTNQPNGAFPAGLQLNPHLELTVPGVPDPVHAVDFVPFSGQTAGWPPVEMHLMANPLVLPMPLQEVDNDPAGSLDSVVILPTTPAGAFMKGEALQHESEAGQFEQAIEDAIEALQNDVTPLPGQVDDVQQFLETVKEAVDVIREQTEGEDDCGGGADPCGPILEDQLDKLTKKVNKLRRAVRKLD